MVPIENRLDYHDGEEDGDTGPSWGLNGVHTSFIGSIDESKSCGHLAREDSGEEQQ